MIFLQLLDLGCQETGVAIRTIFPEVCIDQQLELIRQIVGILLSDVEEIGSESRIQFKISLADEYRR